MIGPELARRGAAPFDKELDALLQRVKAHDAGPGFAEADRALRAKVTAARGAIPPATTDGAGFAAEVVVGLVHFAAGEYEEAFADGRLVAPVEYQDGRGFVTEAKRLVKDREAALAQADPARLESLQEHLAALDAIWPTPLPPATPGGDTDRAWSLVMQVESDAGGFPD